MCGSKEGFVGKVVVVVVVVGRVGPGVLWCVEKTGHLSSHRWGISELETTVIIKSPLSPRAPLFLSLALFLLAVSTYLTYRSASQGTEEG